MEVWKKACRQALVIYKTLKETKDYGLKNQMERSAVSVPSNIAEGQERDTKPDFIRFLRIAKGSNGELRTQLYLATKLEIISTEQSNELINENKQISKMLQGLINSVELQNG
ncbi:four helix bundle protein [Rubritalea tangerina]|uniref:four helix bundle protein n=1 Tax=Rubritalea tangerina TaxID=430798 RepID=UPI003619213D